MGHEVVHFDYIGHAEVDKDGMNDLFLSAVRGGKFDLVIIATNIDECYTDALDQAKKLTITCAWNSDDDWRWEDYSKTLCPHFSYMATTYRDVYERNRGKYPNLLLSQWGCPGFYDGLNTKKDIDFSFVGQIHGIREHNVSILQSKAGLQTFGAGTRKIEARICNLPFLLMDILKSGGSRNSKQNLKKWILARITAKDDALEDYKAVNKIWCKSKISYTPLENSHQTGLQIKGRIFEMGMSGTLMLCNRNQTLDDYYTRNVEYVDYEDIEDCITKAKYYLSHESDRQSIARNYYERTKREHMWYHRLEQMFRQMGLGKNN